MEKEKNTIYCSRCGAEMKSNSRYCMKCGNLNYDHPDNKSMLNYKDKDDNGYIVGSGKSVLGKNNNQVINSIANNTGNKKLLFGINVSIYIIIILITLLVSLLSCNFDLIKLMSTSVPMLVIIYSFIFIFIYSFELVFIKMNMRWWASLIPVYNYMLLSESLFSNKMLGLLTLVPVVNIIYIIVLYYNLGKPFKFNGIITAILPFIAIPIIGFGSRLYDGRNFVDYEEENSIEKDYKSRNNALSIALLFMIIGGAMFTYANMSSVEKGINVISNY